MYIIVVVVVVVDDKDTKISKSSAIMTILGNQRAAGRGGNE